MNEQERAELKQKIIEEIRTQKHLIESFTETSKPVAPDNAIGRLTRMEAISCLLYTSPSPRDQRGSRMPSSA